MNKFFRVIWCNARQAYVVTHEKACSFGKPVTSASAAVVVALFMLSATARAADLPTGGQIVGGSGSIATSGNTMTVTQTTDRMAADWQSFNIGKGNTVNFVQPNSNSVALNRVLGSDVSVIQGALNANGKLFLVNPNGVIFSKDAQVNVGSIVASTLNISTNDFMAGSYRFEGQSSNAIVNQGNIIAHGDGSGGGTVALIAAKIVNEGSMAAHKGNVLMGAGSRVTLNLGGPVSIEVEQGAIDALIEQGGAIKADGGLVYLSAKAAGDLTSTVINHTGITEAQTLAMGESGEIYLMGDMEKGRIEVAGTLDASAPNGGDGGFIETSAANVQIQDGIQVTTKSSFGKTGEWLIDPVNITIASSGGNVTGGAIATALQTSNVTLDTDGAGACSGVTCTFSGSSGDIFIKDNIQVSDGTQTTTLTLKANRDIVVDPNKTISRAGAYGLNVVFWADQDDTGGGSILLQNNGYSGGGWSGVTISTNGGHLWLGGSGDGPVGGNGTATWNGLTVGDGYAMASTAHNVNLSGNSAPSYWNGITLSSASINTNGGSVALYGKSKNQTAASQGYIGVLFDKSSISSGNGDIDISAISESASTNASWNYGLLMTTYLNNQTSSIASVSGDIRVIGETLFPKDTHGAGVGLYGWSNPDSLVEIRSASGDIDITGRLKSTGWDGQYGGIFLYGTSKENIVSQTGNISLYGFSANPNVAGINVETGNTTSSIGYDGTSAFSGNITLNADTFINYPGAITASQLTLLGSNTNYTLTNPANNVASLTATAGSVTYVDSNSLRLGAITLSGKLNVATITGDLTIGGNLSADSTANDAIVLNAGKSAAVGSSTGGNILVSGSPTISTGTGGRATFYTGSVSGSTGLSALIGSGYSRYNADETTDFSASGWTNLDSSGKYAIYREQPTIAVTANADSKTYDGLAYSGGNGVNLSGFKNGDTSSILGGTLSYAGTSQGAINAGRYTIVPSGYSNGLGYALDYVNGTLTINQVPQVEKAVASVQSQASSSASDIWGGTTTQSSAQPKLTAPKSVSFSAPGLPPLSFPVFDLMGGLSFMDVGGSNSQGLGTVGPLMTGPMFSGGTDVWGGMNVFVQGGGFFMPPSVPPFTFVPDFIPTPPR